MYEVGEHDRVYAEQIVQLMKPSVKGDISFVNEEDPCLIVRFTEGGIFARVGIAEHLRARLSAATTAQYILSELKDIVLARYF